MEVIFCAVLTAIWWILSTTVLLPFVLLLKYSKSFSDRWFSFIFTKSFKYILFKWKVAHLRKKAFELLHEDLTQRRTSKPLKVLEIGVGYGCNLEFYPENCRLTALDPNVNYATYFRETLKKYPKVVLEKTVVSMAENMKDIEDSSMDVVITTYVLCFVIRMDDVMKEIKRVLKPGGKYLFHEHVNHPKSDWGYKIQKCTAPLWHLYFGGCHLMRNIDDDIKNAGFSHVICNKVYPKYLILYARPQIFGIATK